MKKFILILGAISLVISLIPYIGVIAIIPAILGIVLGIIYATKEEEKKGILVLGTVLSFLSLIIICFWIILFGVSSINSLYKINSGIEEINNKIVEINTTNSN